MQLMNPHLVTKHFDIKCGFLCCRGGITMLQIKNLNITHKIKMNLSGANVLILDEPTRNFSPLSNPVIREVLASYKGAIISISHDRKYINEVCDTIYELTIHGLKKYAII